MSSLLKFFIEIGKLKESKRSGWLSYGVKEPETTADHIFRAAILAWALNKQKGLNGGEVIKSVLAHHLYEAYIGDITPYGYLLPKSITPKERNNIVEILKNPPPFSLGEQKRRIAERHKEEGKAIKKLVSKLPEDIKIEIEGFWDIYVNRKGKLGKFVWQAAKTESFLQAMEYWKKEGKIQYKLWNRWAKRNLKDPVVLKFKREIDKTFFSPRKKRQRDFMAEILNFVLEIGKLKELKRTGWILRKVKKPETVAQHTFQLAIMSWLLGKIKGLDTERIIKIALAHDLCEVYAGDQTPYDPILVSNKEEVLKIVSKPPRMPRAQRLEWFLKKRGQEWKAIVKLTSNLPKGLQEEIVNLWIDCEEGLTKEGRFVSQVDKMVNLFQAIEYWKEDKKFPIGQWWIFVKERVDDPLLLKFVEELDKEFAGGLESRKKS